jgi:hypothetical protein
LIRGYTFDEIEQCICFVAIAIVWVAFSQQAKGLFALICALNILRIFSLYPYVANISLTYGCFFGIMGIYVENFHYYHHLQPEPERIASS